MNRIVQPGQRSGCVTIPASKSCAHRLLICAAFSNKETTLICDGISKDIAATMHCLNELGAVISVKNDQIRVIPVTEIPDHCDLYCGESGSTLRFLLPIVGALGVKGVFHMEGRLPERPLSPLKEELMAHGMQIRQQNHLLYCEGQLTSGYYEIPGNISSQYISGLLFALPLLDGDSTLTVTDTIESASYIDMTENALLQYGFQFIKFGHQYNIPGRQQGKGNQHLIVESDWSNAAFFLCMGALSEKGIQVSGLHQDSRQGDRKILDLLRSFGSDIIIENNNIFVKKHHLSGICIDAREIPDLIPTISAVAAISSGITKIEHAARLRLKETDRLTTTAEMLRNIGADIEETADGLIIYGKDTLSGGTIDACNDHRIAMAAAVAACACDGPVHIIDAECVQKSYPAFWEHFDQLEIYSGGKHE